MYLAAITSSPLLDAAFGLLALSPLAVMLALVVRHRRRKARRRVRDAMHRGERLNVVGMVLNHAKPYRLPKGSATLDALAALALCLVLSAALVALIACADAADLAALVKP